MTGLRPSLADQINDLVGDLRAMQVLAEADSPYARGAALAAAHSALILAVTPAIDEDMQMIRQEVLYDALPVLAEAGLGHVVPLIEAALSVDITAGRLALGVERPQYEGAMIHLEPDDIARFTAAAEARPNDIMNSATAIFRAMATAAREGDRDGVAASAVVVADTSLQLCVSPATTWEGADDKARFLRLMVGWAWPRLPALSAVLEAARRAEALAWGGEV